MIGPFKSGKTIHVEKLLIGKVSFSVRFAHFKKRAPWALFFLKRAKPFLRNFCPRAGNSGIIVKRMNSAMGIVFTCYAG